MTRSIRSEQIQIDLPHALKTIEVLNQNVWYNPTGNFKVKPKIRTHKTRMMKVATSITAILCTLLMVPLAVAQHSPGDILYKRTDGLSVAGDDFTGALPDNTDQAAPFGTLDDPGSSIITEINVDREPGFGGVDLTGDNHDLAFTFQFHDADGVFSFTENYDDRVQIVITPITGPNNLTSTGAAQTHSDVAWDVRTFANYDFGAGGWFNADVHMTEDGGGAQSAADIGFGYFNLQREIRIHSWSAADFAECG